MTTKNQFGFRSFAEVLKLHGQRTPKKIAFRLLDVGQIEDEVVSFERLQEEVNKLSSRLAVSYNVGERVVLLYPTGVEFVVAFLSCLQAGLVAVTVTPAKNTNFEPSWNWLQECVQNENAKAILTTNFLARFIRNRISTIDVVDTENVEPAAVSSFFVGRPQCEASIHYCSNRNQSTPNRWTHGELFEMMTQLKQLHGHSKNSVIMGCLPQHKGRGLFGHVLQPIFVGCSSVLMSPHYGINQPTRWVNAIAKFKATTVGAPESVYERCAHSSKNQPDQMLDLSNLNFAYSETQIDETIQSVFRERYSANGLSDGVFRAPRCQAKSEKRFFFPSYVAMTRTDSSTAFPV